MNQSQCNDGSAVDRLILTEPGSSSVIAIVMIFAKPASNFLITEISYLCLISCEKQSIINVNRKMP